MTLREKRCAFTLAQAKLVIWVNENLPGYELAIKYAYRCPDCPTGHKKSLHKEGLAADYDLYIDGVYQKKSAAHIPIHRKWVDLGGSPMITRDGNHYSFEHRGMRIPGSVHIDEKMAGHF